MEQPISPVLGTKTFFSSLVHIHIYEAIKWKVHSSTILNKNGNNWNINEHSSISIGCDVKHTTETKEALLMVACLLAWWINDSRCWKCRNKNKNNQSNWQIYKVQSEMLQMCLEWTNWTRIRTYDEWKGANVVGRSHNRYYFVIST